MTSPCLGFPDGLCAQAINRKWMAEYSWEGELRTDLADSADPVSLLRSLDIRVQVRMAAPLSHPRTHICTNAHCFHHARVQRP